MGYQERLKSFFDPLVFRYKVTKEVKKQTDRLLASDFNVIQFFGVDEIRLSKIIAFLLDPTKEHAQGDIFLKKFMQSPELGVSDDHDTGGVVVTTEAAVCESRRIDILLEFKDGFMLGIENKPWAEDQEKQLHDYAIDIDSRTKGNYKLLYLSGEDREPSDWSIPRETRKSLQRYGKLVCITYAGFLASWLKECFKECEAERIRYFIKDFIAYIDNNFPRGGETYE
ncbi:MAG: hypothetical protein PWR18_944 [Synergistales bacterium]|nr:hypothetical protein [Synergistales bacterium]